MLKRKSIFAAAAAVLTFTLSACSAGSAPEETEPAIHGYDHRIIVPHAFGETTLTEVPERVVAIGWGNEATPLALGIVPVGTSEANYGNLTETRLQPWIQEAYEKLGEDKPVVFSDVDGLDYEAIANAAPDVILASYSGLDKDQYDRLSEIAPVIAYPDQPWQTLWREQTLMNGTALGQDGPAADLVAETDDLIQKKQDEYVDVFGTKTAFMWFNPDDLSSFYVYMPADPRAAYLIDLGMKVPESVQKMAGESGEFSVPVSRENAKDFEDVEMIVCYGNDQLLAKLQKDPVYSQLPAIKNGAVAVIDDQSDLAGAATPTILSIPATIDDYMKLLADAAKNVQ